MRKRLYSGQGMFMAGPGIEKTTCASHSACMVYGAVLFGRPIPRLGLDVRGEAVRVRLTFDIVPSPAGHLGADAWHFLSLGGALAYRF